MSTDDPSVFNVVDRLRLNAQRFPDKVGLVYPVPGGLGSACAYAAKTYRAIDRESDAFARGFVKAGITRGTRTILMVKPGRREPFSVTLGLLKVGAVPVVVDPGMGIARMLHCYATVGADAFVGIPIAHAVRVLFRGPFASLRTVVTVGKRYGWGGPTLDELAEPSDIPFPIAETRADDLLIINFTTGSTGPAKGVEYTHRTLATMLDRIQEHYGHHEDDVALAPLPLFALFHLMVGATAVLPPLDPTKPARADAPAMIDAIERFRVRVMFASPAFLRKVGSHAHAHGVRFSTLEEVVAGGAPVTTAIVESFRALLPARARFHTTYGATEALPIASIESSEILGETSALTRAGRGTCVGRPLAGLEVRAVRITDEPISSWSDDLAVAAGEVGEPRSRGPIVSPRYHADPGGNSLAKIDDAGGHWHRTGDLGWLDAEGRIWFCGRKSQRVTTKNGLAFTVQLEGVFNAHPDVYRTALVGVGPSGAQDAVLCVELQEKRPPAALRRIEAELPSHGLG